MHIATLIAASLALWSATAGAGQEQSDFNLVSPSLAGAPTHQLWATHYFVHAASAAPTGVPFRDKSGRTISDNVSPRDWCLGAIEGTVQITLNGEIRTLNYGGLGQKSMVDCAAALKIDPVKKPWITSTGRSFFSVAAGPFGDGVKGYRLVPFRTIAVDSTTFPFGTVLFIRKAQGVEVTLPSGAIIKHDGYFFAGDTGGAIKGRHIDVFCGATPVNCFPGFIRSDETKTFSASVILDAAVVERLKAAHRQ